MRSWHPPLMIGTCGISFRIVTASFRRSACNRSFTHRLSHCLLMVAAVDLSILPDLAIPSPTAIKFHDHIIQFLSLVCGQFLGITQIQNMVIFSLKNQKQHRLPPPKQSLLPTSSIPQRYPRCSYLCSNCIICSIRSFSFFPAHPVFFDIACTSFCTPLEDLFHTSDR